MYTTRPAQLIFSIILVTTQALHGVNLHTAIRNGEYQTAKWWIRNYPDDIEIRENNTCGDTPLMIAAAQNATHIARLLIDRGADVNKGNFQGHRPLHWAANNGHIAMIDLLIDNDADVNVQHEMGATPLFMALMPRGLGIIDTYPAIKTLLNHPHIRINTQTNNGETPLHETVANNDTEITHTLLNMGANTNARGIWNNTPLHAAILKCVSPCIVHLLIQFGTNIHAVNKNGTPLNEAYRIRRQQVGANEAFKYYIELFSMLSRSDAGTCIYDRARNHHNIHDVILYGKFAIGLNHVTPARHIVDIATPTARGHMLTHATLLHHNNAPHAAELTSLIDYIHKHTTYNTEEALRIGGDYVQNAYYAYTKNTSSHRNLQNNTLTNSITNASNQYS